MKKIAIIDLECTCDNSKTPLIPRDKMEIIEIGCVIADIEGNTYETFNVFVKPVLYPTLTQFCKELTTITQEQIDNGITIKQALTLLDEFLFENNIEFYGSWGDFDKNQILKDIRNSGLNASSFPFLKLKHINISKEYFTRQGLNRKCGVGNALRRQGMTFIGTQHRGIDDVKNIARLIPFTNVPTIIC